MKTQNPTIHPQIDSSNMLQSLTQIAGMFDNIKGMVKGVAIALASWQIGNAVFQKMKTTESQVISLTTTFQDAAKGVSEYQRALAYAAKTPFNVEQVIDAVKTLSVAKLDPWEMVDTKNGRNLINTLGDMANAMGLDLSHSVHALNRALSGEWEIMDNNYKINRRMIPQLAGLTSGTDAYKKAVIDFIVQQKRFIGGMNLQAKSLGGMLSNLGDVVDIFLIGLSGAADAKSFLGNGTLYDSVVSSVKKLYDAASDSPLDALQETYGAFKKLGEAGDIMDFVSGKTTSAQKKMAESLSAENKALTANLLLIEKQIKAKKKTLPKLEKDGKEYDSKQVIEQIRVLEGKKAKITSDLYKKQAPNLKGNFLAEAIQYNAALEKAVRTGNKLDVAKQLSLAGRGLNVKDIMSGKASLQDAYNAVMPANSDVDKNNPNAKKSEMMEKLGIDAEKLQKVLGILDNAKSPKNPLGLTEIQMKDSMVAIGIEANKIYGQGEKIMILGQMAGQVLKIIWDTFIDPVFEGVANLMGWIIDAAQGMLDAVTVPISKIATFTSEKFKSVQDLLIQFGYAATDYTKLVNKNLIAASISGRSAQQKQMMILAVFVEFLKIITLRYLEDLRKPLVEAFTRLAIVARTKFKEIGDAIKEAFKGDNFVSTLDSFSRGVMRFFANFIDGITRLFDKIPFGNIIRELLPSLQKFFDMAIILGNTLLDLISEIWTGFTEMFSVFLPQIMKDSASSTSNFLDIITDTAGVLNDALQTLKPFFKYIGIGIAFAIGSLLMIPAIMLVVVSSLMTPLKTWEKIKKNINFDSWLSSKKKKTSDWLFGGGGASGTWGKLKNDASKAYKTVREEANKMMSKGFDFLKSLKLENVPKAIFNYLKDGWDSAVAWFATTWLGQIFSGAKTIAAGLVSGVSLPKIDTSGISQVFREFTSKLSKWGQALADWWASVKFEKTGSFPFFGVTSAGKFPSLNVGSWNLPDDMTANIHKGEMIIPASIAETIRNKHADTESIFKSLASFRGTNTSSSDKVFNINQNFYGQGGVRAAPQMRRTAQTMVETL